MNMKVFGVLLALVVIAVGIASYSLFTGGDSTDPTTDAPPVVVKDDPPPQETPVPVVNDSNQDNTSRDVVQNDPEDTSFSPLGSLVVQGKVTNAADKKPVVGADVIVHDDEGDALESSKSGEDGSYSITLDGLVPPKILVSAESEDNAAAFVAAEIGAGEQRTITLDLELGAAFTIEGRVSNAATGQPVEEAEVELRCLAGPFGDAFEAETTDRNGYYKIGPVTSFPRTGLDVFVEGEDLAPMVRAGLSVEPGQSVLRVDFSLYGNIKLKGRVASQKNGNPIADALISAASADPEYSDLGEDEATEDDGSFELELQSTPYEGLFALFSAEGHSAVAMRAFPPPAADGTIDVGTVLLPAPITVSGYVVNKRTGQPVKGGDITIYAAGAPGKDEFDYTDSEVIDMTTGRFSLTLENTPPDDAEILVEPLGCVDYREKLLLQPNVGEQEVRIEVEPTILFTGRVKRQVDGSPVIGALVKVMVGRERLIGRAAGADATFRVEIPPNVDLSQSSVQVQWADKRFKLGAVPSPAAGTFEVSKDMVIDLPAGVGPRR